jgi:NADH dehydrogenase
LAYSFAGFRSDARLAHGALRRFARGAPRKTIEDGMTQDRFADGRLVTVFGGSGFIGRHVVRALARRGWRVRAAVRRPDLAFHLQPLGGVGQVTAVQANVRYPDSVAAALRGADAAVNLVGVLAPSGRNTFEGAQAFGAQAVAECCKAAGIASLAHLSAIGAEADAASDYARTKAEGERATLAAVPGAVVLRPSVVFGPEDQFFNRFATLARLMPVLPVVGAATKLQPVFVGDVAEAVARALEGRAQAGGVYELGGPDVMTMREAMEFTLAAIHRKRILIDVPAGPAKAMAFATNLADKLSLGLMPQEFVTTPDQITLLSADNVVSDAAVAQGRTLAGLGIKPSVAAAIAPTYLYRYRKTGQFDRANLA